MEGKCMELVYLNCRWKNNHFTTVQLSCNCLDQNSVGRAMHSFSLLNPQFKYIKFHILHFHNAALLNANQYSFTFTKVFILYTYLFSLTLFITVKLGVFTRNYTCQLEKKIVITIEISWCGKTPQQR